MHKKVIDHAREWLAIESEGIRNPAPKNYQWFGCKNDKELGREIEKIATEEGINLDGEWEHWQDVKKNFNGELDDVYFLKGIDLIALEAVLAVMFFG